MKKLLFLFLCVSLLVSCVSTDIEYISTTKLNSNKVFIQLDPSSSAISSGGVGYVSNSGWAYMSSSTETIKLGTIKNKEIIRKALQEKGYEVVNSFEDADIILVGESTSNEFLSTVTLGFYEKQSQQLLFVCEGKYGYGWGMQSDLNHAVSKALESVPSVK